MQFMLIADKSQAYVDMQREMTLDSWGAEPAAIQKIAHVGESGGATLFGDEPVSILHLEKAEHVHGTVASLEQSVKNNTLDDMIGSGLIITTNVAQQSLKKLNALVEQQGGTVVTPLHVSKDRDSPAAKLLRTLNLRTDVRQVILDYVGDDYDSLIPIVRGLSDIPKNKHRAITVEHMMLRLPQTPGVIPIWEVWNNMERGNLRGAVKAYRRLPSSASMGVVIHIKNTLGIAYRVAGVLEHNPKTTKDELKVITDVKSTFRLDKITKLAKANTTKRLSRALETVSTTEQRLKGGWPQSMTTETVEIMLVTLQRILRR